MDREEALTKASDAKNLSQQGLQLIKQGKYREGHNLIRQAVEANKYISSNYHSYILHCYLGECRGFLLVVDFHGIERSIKTRQSNA
jgi:hypothetical protein